MSNPYEDAIRQIDQDLRCFTGTRKDLLARIRATVNQAIEKAESK